MAQQGFDISKYITAQDIAAAVTAGIVAYVRNRATPDDQQQQPTDPTTGQPAQSELTGARTVDDAAAAWNAMGNPPQNDSLLFGTADKLKAGQSFTVKDANGDLFAIGKTSDGITWKAPMIKDDQGFFSMGDAMSKDGSSVDLSQSEDLVLTKIAQSKGGAQFNLDAAGNVSQAAPAAEPALSANDYVDNVKDQISYMTKKPRFGFSHGNINGLPPTKIPLTGVGGRMAGNVIYGDLENLADESGLFDGTFADANDVANALVAFGAKKGMNLNTLLNMMKHMPNDTFSALAQNIDGGTADDFLTNCFTQWHAAAGSSLGL